MQHNNQKITDMKLIPLSKFRTSQTETLLHVIKGESVILTSRVGNFKLVAVSEEEIEAIRAKENTKEQSNKEGQ